MVMNSLRARMIRLAYENPELRGDLLPLLKTARKLHKRQEKVLQKYLDSAGSRAVSNFDDLPSNVRSELERIKNTETLWSDVERWLGDNNNPHLQSKWAAGVGEGFKILVKSWDLSVVEDSFDEGEIGRSRIVDSGQFEPGSQEYGGSSPVGELIRDFAQRPGAPKDRKAWMAFENGRIIAQWQGNEYGDALTPKEIEQWKKGEIKGYSCSLNIYLKFAKVWTPSPKEMSKVFKIQTY